MPPAQDSTVAGFALDRSRNTIRFERDLPVDPAQAFAAWTDPRQLECWWDPTGELLARCEIDLRVGGSFTFVSRAHPERPFTGTYRTIDPPGLLAFDAVGAKGTVELSRAGNGTRMIVEIACSSPEHLRQFVDM